MSSTYRPHSGVRAAGLSTEDYDCTLDEVGQELGVSRERARQIESRALAKAYKILTAQGYTLADFLEGARHE